MKQNKKTRGLGLHMGLGCLLLLALYSAGVSALESDGDQPIIIDSDRATYDDVKAISTYTGNVVSIQGSIKVDSDKLVVYFIDGEADKMVFTGNKAKFKQTPHEGDKDITGEALTGEYYPKKDLLILIDKATVWEGSGAYTSDIIEYDLKTSLVKAGEKESASKRVHVVLQPKDKEEPKGKDEPKTKEESKTKEEPKVKEESKAKEQPPVSEKPTVTDK